MDAYDDLTSEISAQYERDIESLIASADHDTTLFEATASAYLMGVHGTVVRARRLLDGRDDATPALNILDAAARLTLIHLYENGLTR